MVHSRLKQRIISDTPSAPLSPESGNPTDVVADDKDQNQDADADMDDEGESMNISEDEQAAANEDDGGDQGSLESNRGHALTHFNSRGPATSSSQNNNGKINIKNTKRLYAGSRSASASVSRVAAIMEHSDFQPQPSDPSDSSVRRSSRVKPPSASKELAESSRSPAKRSLKIKLKLGSKPTPELEDEKSSIAATPPTRSSARRGNRGGRTRSKGKNSSALTFTLPARPSEVVSSRRSLSPSEISPRTSPESEDDPDAEMDIYQELEPEPGAEGVNINEQDDENMDDDGDNDDDEDSEVLPGQRSRSRMTSRQAALASKVDPEHVELGSTGPSRKKQLTSEEIALRREETARKRKNLNEKKLEGEKMDTINRLLKKQSSRSRTKRSAFNTSVAATPQSHSAGEEGESDHVVLERSKGMPGPAWKWISSKDGYRLGIPIELLQDLESSPPPPPPPSSTSRATCDIHGCLQNRKYRLTSDFNRGACGLEHLKILSNKC